MYAMSLNDSDKEMAKRTLRQYCSSWEEVRYDEMHNKPYFVGKRDRNSQTEIVHPVNCYKNLSFAELKSCIVDSGSSSVNLAVYGSDSTVVLYKAELGLKPPVLLNKERDICPCSNKSNETTFRKKRKLEISLDSCLSDHSAKESTNHGFRIDLKLYPDSELSESNASTLKDTEDSIILTPDKLNIACS